MLKDPGSPSFCPPAAARRHTSGRITSWGTYQNAATTAATAADFSALLQFFRAAQSAGAATKITKVHLVSIPSPHATPKSNDHFVLENSVDFRSAQIEIATRVTSQYSS